MSEQENYSTDRSLRVSILPSDEDTGSALSVVFCSALDAYLGFNGISMDQAGKILGVSSRTLYRYRKGGPDAKLLALIVKMGYEISILFEPRLSSPSPTPFESDFNTYFGSYLTEEDRYNLFILQDISGPSWDLRSFFPDYIEEEPV